MKALYMRIIINIAAALIGIGGIILANIYPDLKDFIFNIELVALPLLFIILNDLLLNNLSREKLRL